MLFLKCFSKKERGTWGPYRFSPRNIKALFGRRFEAKSIKETVYQGTLKPYPHALFCILRKI